MTEKPALRSISKRNCLAHPGPIGRSVRGKNPRHQQTSQEYLSQRRVDGSGSYFHFGNNCHRRQKLVYFIAVNAILYRPDGSKRLADNALVALTLLIAESRPEEKETIVKVIVNLINRSND